MKKDLIKKIEVEKIKEDKGWDVVIFSIEHKDLGALLNGMEIIQTAKIKGQAHTELLASIIINEQN